MASPEGSSPPEPSGSSASSSHPPEPGSAPSAQSSEPPDSAPPYHEDPPGSSGFFDWVKGNMLIVGGAGAGVVAVIVIVVLLVMVAGGGGPSGPGDYVLDGAAAVAVVDVAAILEAPAIPAQLPDFSSVGFPRMDPGDRAAWIEAWEAEWADDFPRIWDGIRLEDITTVLLQEDEDGRDLGWIFFGEFAFADVRDTLEDGGRESGDYRKFEVWGDDVALLEDRGAILVGTFVPDVLKALDTERGFADDASSLMQALGRAGDGLVSVATATCSGSFFPVQPRGCESLLESVTSGDQENTIVTGVYVFGSESRAESGLEDIEDAVDGQDTYDADLNRIEAEGIFVSYEASIVGEFAGGPTAGLGGGSGPLSYALENIKDLTIVNVAALLESSEIPGILPAYPGVVNFLPDVTDEPDEWKEAWEDLWDGSFLGLLGEVFFLSDVTSLVLQTTEDNDSGILLFGDFPWDDVREFLEDEGFEEDSYRDFEVWEVEGRGPIALLEDRGLIAHSSEQFVRDLLKALDTGEGLLDETGELSAALYRVGEGLVLFGTTSCEASMFGADLRSCDAFAEVIEGGDPDMIEVSGVFVFSSERRAESGMEDLQDAIEDHRTYDADIENTEAEGEFVSYEVIIHQ